MGRRPKRTSGRELRLDVKACFGSAFTVKTEIASWEATPSNPAGKLSFGLVDGFVFVEIDDQPKGKKLGPNSVTAIQISPRAIIDAALDVWKNGDH